MTTKSPRSILRLVCTAGIVAAVLFGGAVSTAFAAASLTPLGYLPGGTSSGAYGVSGDGSVVVGASSSDSGYEAFRWTSGGGMVGLGVLPGDARIEARGVSADGSVIVGSSVSGPVGEAFRWTSDGGMVGLGYLPGGSFSSVAEGASGDGSVVVGSSISVLGSFEAFRWTSDGGMMGLGKLPGAFFSHARGVSADGSVVVGRSDFGDVSEAFRWTSDGGMIGLGKLPGGLVNSGATGVSADGSVVVGVGYSDTVYEAFRWTSGGGMVGLGDLLGGGFSSQAFGVSGDGSVVVGFSVLGPSDETGAFYWTADGGMRALWDVLLSHGVDPAADGWTELSTAYGISADGNTIVGYGWRNGNAEAFVAVVPTIVPEPAAGALALVGVSNILLLRRRSLWRPNKLKVLRWRALTGAVTLMAVAPAAAIDTEPLNNSQLTADSLPTLLPGTAISNFARLDGTGGDVDFFQTPLAAGEVLFGMVTPLAGLPTSFTPPDTVVSLFDDTGARTFNEDDDAGELADIEQGYGSVFRFLSPATSDYRIGVSGSSDYEFDGAASGESHSETGGYVLTAGRINPAVPGGGFTDTDPANQTAAGAGLIPVTPGTARVAVAHLGDADVDFFRLDLHAGDVLSAMTAPLNDLGFSFNSPDTLIGLFDSSGTNLLVANDDSGGYSWIYSIDPETGEIVLISPDLSSDFPGDQFGGLASALRAYIPADGTYYLAVTGYGDDGFVGAHSETGAYALLVGVAAVPEPGGAMLAAVAMLLCGPGRFRKRNRVMRAAAQSMLVVCAAGLVSTPAAAATLTPLGDLPGGDFASGAKSISADGSVVVGWSYSDSGREAFRWTNDSGMIGLGDLPGGRFKSEANGVSGDGSVIVGWGTTSDSLSQEAFRWTPGGGMVSLGYLPGGGGHSYATSVSADGSVIVGSSDAASGGGAFRWTSDGGMVGLGGLLDDYGSAATGVSADGSVVVGWGPSASNFGENEASRWTADDGMVGLGGLPGGTFSFSSGATGVSGDGSVVVGWNYLSGLNFPDVYYYDLEFFRWTSDGGMVGLGTLPGGEYGGEATGVSADGSVIVGYNFTTWDTAAFLWTSGGGLQRLWDVLVAHGVDPAADGWTGLTAAYDISADGTTIVGSGPRNGNIEAFVAVIPIVPEPAGDFDHDGDVDGDDLLKWQGDFGQNGASDADDDGDSDGADFLAWQRQLGGAPSVATKAVVPEPGSLALLTLSVSALVRRRRLHG